MANKKPRDLIDRQALGIGRCDPDAFPLQNRGYCAGWNVAVNLLEQAPRVDAVEVVHAQWEIVEPKRFPNLTARIRCSACKKEPQKHSYEERGHGYSFTIDSWDATDYCPNCGAKMEGKDNG